MEKLSYCVHKTALKLMDARSSSRLVHVIYLHVHGQRKPKSLGISENKNDACGNIVYYPIYDILLKFKSHTQLFVVQMSLAVHI